jgi:hypothetical protein
MKIALALLTASIASAQFFPFPGPGSKGSGGGGGGGNATFKSSSQQNVDAAGTTISTPGTLNVAAGDLIVVGVATSAASAPTITVACGVDSLTQIQQIFDSDDGPYAIALFYKENATANATATCTATTPNQAFRAIGAANYSGIVTSSSLMGSSCNGASCNDLSVSTTNRTAQNIVTANKGLLVAFIIDWNGTTHTAANGYTLRYDGTTPAYLDKVGQAAGTYPSGNFSTVSPTDNYLAIFAAFREL